MQVLNGRFEVDRLLRAVGNARTRVLLLDFDGTLAPFSVERAEVRLYDGLRPILEAIAGAPRHRLVFVTGRPAGELSSLLDIGAAPWIWGSHGMESLGPDRRVRAAPLPVGAGDVLDREAAHLRATYGAERLERKPFGVALHVRGIEPARADAAIAATTDRWRRLPGPHGLRVRRFEGGLELCAGTRNKGDAVASALRALDGPVAAAFFGDDLTDEDAFRAMRGRGAAVLVRDELRPTAADLWLRPPGELIEFLSDWRDAATGGRSWA